MSAPSQGTRTPADTSGPSRSANRIGNTVSDRLSHVRMQALESGSDYNDHLSPPRQQMSGLLHENLETGNTFRLGGSEIHNTREETSHSVQLPVVYTSAEMVAAQNHLDGLSRQDRTCYETEMTRIADREELVWLRDGLESPDDRLHSVLFAVQQARTRNPTRPDLVDAGQDAIEIFLRYNPGIRQRPNRLDQTPEDPHSVASRSYFPTLSFGHEQSTTLDQGRSDWPGTPNSPSGSRGGGTHSHLARRGGPQRRWTFWLSREDSSGFTNDSDSSSGDNNVSRDLDHDGDDGHSLPDAGRTARVIDNALQSALSSIRERQQSLNAIPDAGRAARVIDNAVQFALSSIRERQQSLNAIPDPLSELRDAVSRIDMSGLTGRADLDRFAAEQDVSLSEAQLTAVRQARIHRDHNLSGALTTVGYELIQRATDAGIELPRTMGSHT